MTATKHTAVLLAVWSATSSSIASDFSPPLRFGAANRIASEEYRARMPVLIVVCNDLLALPRADDEAWQGIGYLSRILKGERDLEYLRLSESAANVMALDRLTLLSEDDAAILAAFAKVDRDYLSAVGQFITYEAGVSEASASSSYEASIDYINRSNPKYRLGWSSIRNAYRPRPLTPGNREIPWRLYDPNSDQTKTFQGRRFEIQAESKPHLEFPLSSQWVGSAAVLKEFFVGVAQAFPPKQHRFFLVVRSHAYRDKVIAPYYSVSSFALRLKAQDIWREFLKRRPLAVDPVTGKIPTTRQNAAKTNELLHDLRRRAMPDAPPAYEGLTLEEFFVVLRDAGRVGDGPPMEFAAVALDSPASSLGSVESHWPECPNVGLFFGLKNEAGLMPIDFSSLFSFVGVEETDFQDRFIHFLER